MSLVRASISGRKALNSFRNGLYYCVRHESEKLESATHKVNNLEKKFLVWTGKYKSVEDVPARVNQNVMERARNKMRIKISNYMMAFTAVGCVIMVVLGKQAAKRGESLSSQSSWHLKEKPEEDKNQ